MHTRNRRIARFLLGNTRFSRLKNVYYIKNVYYGSNIDSYIYNNVQLSFKNERESFEKKTDGVKLERSIYRARNKIFRIVEANINPKIKPIFFTLTSEDQITDLKLSNQKIKAFIRRLKQHSGENPKYIVVPERHKSGAVHYHGVLFNIKYVDVRYFRFNIWKYGYVDLQIPRKIRSVSAYLSKYLTKETLENIEKNGKTYFTSRGLEKITEKFESCKPDGILKVVDITKTRKGQIIKYKKQND